VDSLALIVIILENSPRTPRGITSLAAVCEESNHCTNNLNNNFPGRRVHSIK